MTDTRDIKLGGRIFAVPPLPLRINRTVYPLCRALSTGPDGAGMEASFIGRVLAANGSIFAATDDELDKLADIAFGAANAADKSLTREEFDDLPITPVELLDAFFAIRPQTGVWIAPKASDEAGEQGQGEAQGAEAPQT